MATTDRDRVIRNGRGARWFHAVVYVTVLMLLATGWWLTLGQEGRPSVVARLTGVPDTVIHTWSGWALVLITVPGLAIGRRGWLRLLRDSVRFRRSDLSWFVRWPRAALTGRFARHDGRFDPAQRGANLVMIMLLLILIGSGLGLVLASGGPVFAVSVRLHRWATFLFTPVVLGHILIAAGVLPGYRGVWRAMHFGGRLRRSDSERVWPGWTEELTDEHNASSRSRPE